MTYSFKALRISNDFNSIEFILKIKAPGKILSSQVLIASELESGVQSEDIYSVAWSLDCFCTLVSVLDWSYLQSI